MIDIWLVTWLVLSHFIGDFFLQTNWMALNKSKDFKALLSHTLIYSLCFLWLGWEFALVTFLLHTGTDAVTSQLTSRWWFIDLQPRSLDMSWSPYPYYAGVDGFKRALFWRTIGLDQAIHLVTLPWTLHWLGII